MSKDLKKPTTYDQQITKLKSKGLNIPDEAAAVQTLQELNYYRLSGYWYQLLQPKFKDGTTFTLIQSLHEFDMELRHILMYELEKLELFFRTQLAYLFSHKHGTDGHYQQENFRRPSYHEAFVNELSIAMHRNKDMPFVAHHRNNYDGRMPLWRAVEVLSFTALSKFYSNLLISDQRDFALQMGFNATYLTNWLHALSVLRNICAHYGRLYNRTMSPPINLGPRTLRNYPQIEQNTLFAYIVVLLRCQRQQSKKNTIVNTLANLINQYAASLYLRLLGFPADWPTLLCDSKLI